MTKTLFPDQNKGEMLFIPFITAGDPIPEATVDLALMLQEIGADAIELGIPYSDPLADGPVIQRASMRALDHGMTLEKAMALVPLMRKKGLKIPVIIFTYYNLLLQLGEPEFIRQATSQDIDGLLVPDLPFEESESLREACKANGISYISLVAPTTSKKRLAIIGEEAEGFLYCVSSLGVTGVRQQFHAKVFDFLADVRESSSVPIAVGFGISSYDQVQALRDYCDGFIVGSAIVKEIESKREALRHSEERSAAIGEIKEKLIQHLFKPSEVSS